MKEQTTEGLIESRPSWEDVEAFARQRIQTWFQRLLEEEVEELRGRARYARRDGVDAPLGYRNGLGKSRRLTLSAGTITVRQPRVRGLAERFESRLLPLFQRRTGTVGQLLPTLYLHGLAKGDFDLALRGLLGEGAPLSASSIARLKASWQAEYNEWQTRSLADLEPVYLWVDGVYVKAGSRRTRRRCSSSSPACATAAGRSMSSLLRTDRRTLTSSRTMAETDFGGDGCSGVPAVGFPWAAARDPGGGGNRSRGRLKGCVKG